MRILLTGAGGQVGYELARTLAPLGVVHALERAALDLADAGAIAAACRANERREIIQSFTRRGIKKLPDGRKVEDIVHTSQSWSKRKQ